MSALKCYKLYATTCLEIYNASFGPWAPVLRVIYLVKLDRPETIHDRAKMNLASHYIRRLSGNNNISNPVNTAAIIAADAFHLIVALKFGTTGCSA